MVVFHLQVQMNTMPWMESLSAGRGHMISHMHKHIHVCAGSSATKN